MRQLAAGGLAPLRAPTHFRFAPREIVACLYRVVMGEDAQKLVCVHGRQRLHLISEMRKHLPDAHDLHAKAELLLFLAGEEAVVDRLASEMQAAHVAKINAIERLPEERRVVMLEEASGISAAVLDWLRDLRARFDGEGRLGLLPKELPELVGSLRGSSLAGPPDAALRGTAQESAASRWAQLHWPGHEVFSGCFAVGLTGLKDGGKGVKQEFDTIVVDASGGLVAIVEAKAGSDLYSDLPKMLIARKLLSKLGDELEFRLGKRGTDAVKVRALAEPPHVAYVFGSGKSLEEIVAASLLETEKGLALFHEFSSCEGAVELPLTDGRVLVRFSEPVLQSLQARMDHFHASLTELMEAGSLSLWVCGDGEAPSSASNQQP